MTVPVTHWQRPRRPGPAAAGPAPTRAAPGRPCASPAPASGTRRCFKLTVATVTACQSTVMKPPGCADRARGPAAVPRTRSRRAPASPTAGLRGGCGCGNSRRVTGTVTSRLRVSHRELPPGPAPAAVGARRRAPAPPGRVTARSRSAHPGGFNLKLTASPGGPAGAGPAAARVAGPASHCHPSHAPAPPARAGLVHNCNSYEPRQQMPVATPEPRSRA